MTTVGPPPPFRRRLSPSFSSSAPRTTVDRWEAVTFRLATAGLLGISLLQGLAAMSLPSSPLGNALGASVCLIAGLHYGWMLADGRGDARVATRYSDWYVTTVLMLLEFFQLAGTLASRWGWALGACCCSGAMILCGHVAEEEDVGPPDTGRRRRTFFLLGSAGGAALLACYVFGTVVDNGSHEHAWAHAFAGLWLLYPVAFWLGPYREVAFNLLDVASKGVFGLTLAVKTML